MFARHLPPSAARPRVLALDAATATELAETADVTLAGGQTAPAGSFDAVAGRVLATAAELAQFAAALRPGGRLILAADDEPERLLEALTRAGYTHCLVEAEGALTLYRGERPPETASTLDRAAQLAASAPAEAGRPRFYFLLVTQTPNKPAWRLAPGERVAWQAATLVAAPGEGPRLLAFTSLVKAVAYMQPAVLAGAIVGVNKVAKFPVEAAAAWPLGVLLNPSFDELRGATAGPPLAVEPEQAITGEE